MPARNFDLGAGIIINAVLEGRADAAGTVVLLHGFPDSSSLWAKQARCPPPCLRCLSPVPGPNTPAHVRAIYGGGPEEIIRLRRREAKRVYCVT